MDPLQAEGGGESFGSSIWFRVVDQHGRIAPFAIVLPNAKSILALLQRGGIDVDVQDSSAIRTHCRGAGRGQESFGVFVAANLNLIRAGLTSKG
jgi:hypothetical protein